MRPTLHDYQFELSGQVEKSNWSKVLLANEYFWKVDKFAKLTNRAPKLGDFVATDEEGNVLDDPRQPAPFCRDCADEDGRCPANNYVPCDPDEALKEYQAAQDRVIFAGDWEFEESDLEACFNGYLKCGKNIWFIQVKDDVMWFEVGEVDTPIYRIEDLPREINFKEGVI